MTCIGCRPSSKCHKNKTPTGPGGGILCLDVFMTETTSWLGAVLAINDNYRIFISSEFGGGSVSFSYISYVSVGWAEFDPK